VAGRLYRAHSASSRPNVLVDAVCQQGLRYLHDGLRRTRSNPDDEEARLNCQLGSWLSAFGLQARVPMGASHAIGHVLGGTCDVPHYCRRSSGTRPLHAVRGESEDGSATPH
jgi:alcohol dehydrogenase class IV